MLAQVRQVVFRASPRAAAVVLYEFKIVILSYISYTKKAIICNFKITQ